MAASREKVLQINANDLSEEEVEYELSIRNKVYEESERQKRDRLKKVFQEEGNDTVIVTEDIFFANEVPLVTRKLEEIEHGLSKTIQVKWISQLRHWKERIYRATVVDLAQEEQKSDIIAKIRKLIRQYKETVIKLMNLSEEEEELGESGGLGLNQIKKENIMKRAPKIAESRGSDLKAKDQGQSFDQDALSKAINFTIGDYFKQFPNIEGMRISIDHENKTKKNFATERESNRNLGAVPKKLVQIGELEKQKYSMKDKGKEHKTKQDKQRRLPKKGLSDDDISSSLDSLSSLLSSESSSDFESVCHSERSEELNWRENRNQHYRLDKWGIQFSGDVHGMEVSDFVFQVNELMYSERIPNDRFLDQAYILFAGEARRWYFTYKKKYRTWDKFSKQLKIRFGDPNKDRKILQDIKDRKQRKGESFVAFCSEIEGMFERMTKQYSERKRLKVLRNNMRRWYKTKLSFYKIKNIGHLSMLCQQLDKDSGKIYPKSTQPSRRHIRNVEASSNSSSSSSDEHEVCAFNRKENQPKQYRNPQQGLQDTHAPDNFIQLNSLCWNCRKYGHRWRECKQPKVIFCHACGTPGFTFFTCPKSHMLPQQAPKNEDTEEK